MQKERNENLNSDEKQSEMLLKQAISAYNKTENGKQYNLNLIKQVIKDLSIEEISNLLKIDPAELEKGKGLDERAEIIFNHKMKKL